LQRTEVHLLTLLGSGGIGKTRLVIQVAATLQKHFVGGVCFISLAALAQKALLLFRELGDKFFIAIALNSLGSIASLQRNITQAEPLTRKLYFYPWN
jgi:hypothetical protein